MVFVDSGRVEDDALFAVKSSRDWARVAIGQRGRFSPCGQFPLSRSQRILITPLWKPRRNFDQELDISPP